MAATLDFDGFDILSFDCYGTLIDFEAGVLAVLRPLLARHGVALPDDALLRPTARSSCPSSRGLFSRSARSYCGRWTASASASGFAPTSDERAALVESLADWPPFRTPSKRSPTLGGISAW